MYDIDEILKFETFEKDFPKITGKNVKLIDFIINNDSNYRSDNDENNVASTINLVKKYKNNQSKDNLEKVIRSIDKQNSTHLSVSGRKKGNKQGIKNTVDYIFDTIGTEKLYKQIEEGQSSLVDEIAMNSINNRYIISFATKFCTYMSRYMFDDDKFSIYDGILASVLPFYYYKYVKEEKITINNEKVKEKGYEWYSSIIDKIIEGARKKENYKISRKDLDHLIWYYYKGDKDIKDDKKNTCYKSRITRARESIK